MNCREVLEAAPLFLSGEMNPEQHRAFTAHLEVCSACEREMTLQSLLDARVAAVLGGDAPDTVRIERAVLNQIEGRRILRRRWFGVAVGAIAAGLIAASYGLLRPTPAAKLYVDAARDHWAEVVEKQPRHWRSGADQIEALARQKGLSLAQTTALAPEGYSLEGAKICGLDGQRMLHLVFTKGRRNFSVFVNPHRG